MHLARKAWTFVSQATISNVWKHIKIFSEDAPNPVEPTSSTVTNNSQTPPSLPFQDQDLEKATALLEESIDTLVAMSALRSNQRISIANLLNPEVEQITEKELTDEEICEEVEAQRKASECIEDAPPEEPEDFGHPLISKKDAIDSLQQVARLLDSLGSKEFSNASSNFASYIRELCRLDNQSMKQCTLNSFFTR
jgi:hypothetical protein